MDKFIAHILVVDDDDGIRSLIKKYLNENNFLVTTANSAENAFEKIKIIKFDLIILDIMMPGKSGLEFIHDHKVYCKLRSRSIPGQLPVSPFKLRRHHKQNFKKNL